MRPDIIVVCLLALASRAPSQVATPSREPAKASLEGSVVKEPGGEPLKKAIVELIAENQEEGGNYTATSDPDGHFRIVGIQSGRYRMFVERPGYLEVDKKRRRSEGVVLSFDAGQELKDQTLRMLPAAILRGACWTKTAIRCRMSKSRYCGANDRRSNQTDQPRPTILESSESAACSAANTTW
jgi:hypothetical protein